MTAVISLLPGMKNYCDRYGEGIYNVAKSFGPVEKLQGAPAKTMAETMDKLVPLDKLDERRQWRDKRLSALAKMKKDMDG